MPTDTIADSTHTVALCGGSTQVSFPLSIFPSPLDKIKALSQLKLRTWRGGWQVSAQALMSPYLAARAEIFSRFTPL